MANVKKSNSTPKNTPPFKGYIRMDIRDSDDLDKFHDFEGKTTKESLWNHFAEMVADGFKVQAKIDGKGYRVEAFNISGEEESQGYILAAYGSNMEKAFCALVFKHKVLLSSSWADHLEQEELEVR